MDAEQRNLTLDAIEQFGKIIGWSIYSFDIDMWVDFRRWIMATDGKERAEIEKFAQHKYSEGVYDSMSNEYDPTHLYRNKTREELISEIKRLREAISFCSGRLDIVPRNAEGKLCIEVRQKLLAALCNGDTCGCDYGVGEGIKEIYTAKVTTKNGIEITSKIPCEYIE